MTTTAEQREQISEKVKRATRLHEFQVLGVTYRANRLPPLTVIGIARRISPFVKPFVSAGLAYEDIAKGTAQDSATGQAESITRMQAMDRIFSSVTPVLDALAQMPEADQNYLIAACLRVTRSSASGYQQELWVEEWGKPSDASMTAGDILGVTAEVLVWTMPELFGELQNIGASLQGAFSAIAGAGARA
jgi:hypothetical protein